MGLIVSRFRKKKSSEQQLEQLQKEIEEIEHNLQHSFERQKTIVGQFLFYSTILYLIIAAISYFYYYPSTWKGRFLVCGPLIGIPFLIFYAKQFVNWIYKRDITRSKNKLSELLSRKKLILEDVMNTETYKKAKDILDKFAPEQSKKVPVLQSPNAQPRTPSPSKGQNQAQTTAPRQPQGAPQSQLRRSPSPLRSPMILQRPPQSMQPPRLIGAVFPPDRGIFDKLVENLLGDGPNNRYALICRHCAGHNGMVLPEEYEYLAYRCVHCGFPHPARKLRPRLPSTPSIVRRPLFPGGPNDPAILPAENDSSDTESGVKIVEVTDDQSRTDDSSTSHQAAELGEDGATDCSKESSAKDSETADAGNILYPDSSSENTDCSDQIETAGDNADVKR